MSARLSPPTDRTIGDLKDQIAEISQEARTQAAYIDRDRPYSSPPPAQHPVWSDALRAETARMRDEGMLPASHAFPWERDPTVWPAADAVTQQTLLAVQEERQAWDALAREIGDAPDDDMGVWNTQGTLPIPDMGNIPDAGWAPGVPTAVDYIQDYGHQPHTQADMATREPDPLLGQRWQGWWEAGLEPPPFSPHQAADVQTLGRYGHGQTTYDGPDEGRLPQAQTPSELRAQFQALPAVAKLQAQLQAPTQEQERGW